jgi:hypothetical protein
MLTFEIRRQPIEESELQSPDDVPSLVEMRVWNDDLPEDVLKEHLDAAEIDLEANVSELLSYPAATAVYTTGANEDTRVNAAMFVFTDVYSYELLATLPIDSMEDYQADVQDWFESAQLVERDPYPGEGNGEDEDAGDAEDSGAAGATDEASAQVKGLWLRLADFKPLESESSSDDPDGTAIYEAKAAEGLTVTILRTYNPGNTLTPAKVAEFIATTSDISEDDVSVTVPEAGEAPFPVAEEYPFAMAEFMTGEEGEEISNAALCFFPDELFFFVHMQGTEDVIAEHSEEIQKWFQGAAFVQQ